MASGRMTNINQLAQEDQSRSVFSEGMFCGICALSGANVRKMAAAAAVSCFKKEKEGGIFMFGMFTYTNVRGGGDV